MSSYPHPSNFCGGSYADWLEVNLLPECDGRCAWCIERDGWHPGRRATWEEMTSAIIATNAANVMLLGGEPLLYRDLRPLVCKLHEAGRRIWLTTNGSRLPRAVSDGVLDDICGINVSLHHYDLGRNRDIVGVRIDESALREAVGSLRGKGIRVRFNCNLIRGQIDSVEEIRRYVAWAKKMCVSGVRIAELKGDDDASFVDLHELFGAAHGLVADPFLEGCIHESVIDGMLVNFRQMCGLQTKMRPRPIEPVQCSKRVLYYDGVIYDGWQTKASVTSPRSVLAQLAAKSIGVEEAMRQLCG